MQIAKLQVVKRQHDIVTTRVASCKPPRFWQSYENQRRFLDDIASSLHVKIQSDLKDISRASLFRYGGTSLLKRYKGRVLEILQTLYPELRFHNFKREIMPHNYWSSEQNQNYLLEQIATLLHINVQYDWGHVITAEITKHGGSRLLGLHKNSIIYLLETVYPNLKWNNKFRRDQMPMNYWEALENQRSLVDDIACSLQILRQRDWNKVTGKILVKNGCGSILTKYNCSIFQLLKILYPELKWSKSSNSSMIHRNFMSKLQNQRLFLDELASSVHIATLKDWKKVTYKLLSKLGGSTILEQYNWSLFESLERIFPEFMWGKWHRNRMPLRYWEVCEHQQQFLDEIAFLLHIQKHSDWSRATYDQLVDVGCGTLLLRAGSVFNLLDTVYSTFFWDMLLRDKLPQNYWNKANNQRLFFDHVARVQNIESQQDFQTLDVKTLYKYGGSSLLQKYPSIFSMIADIYPEFNWQPLQLLRVPRSIWQFDEFRLGVVQQLQNCFDILKKDDWYRLSEEQVYLNTGRNIPKKVMSESLESVYPEEEWNYSEFSRRNKKSRQRWLLLKIREIFPKNEEIFEDFRHPSILRKSGSLIEMDIFIPRLNLAIEFHGEQHFLNIPGAGFSSLENQKFLDEEKLELCAKYGIKLVVIPYWWDNDKESLVGNILKETNV